MYRSTRVPPDCPAAGGVLHRRRRRSGRPALDLTIFTEHWGWQEQQLGAAAAARGLRVTGMSLREAAVDTARPAGLGLPAGGDALPDAVFVRAIPAGSFEQVTLRLGVLHALAARGVVVYNDAGSIERTIDKSATTLALAHRGVPQPATWVCESPAQARAVVREAAGDDRPLVLKPLFGNRGKGLRLVRRPADLPPAESVAGGVYYLQRFAGAEAGASDWRVLVVGGRAVAAMRRRGAGWITNRHQGGECLPAVLEPELAGLAEQAVAAVGAAYAGVDLIRTPAGELLVLEVNGIPAWSGLQSVSGVDIAGLLLDDLQRRLAPAPARPAAP